MVKAGEAESDVSGAASGKPTNAAALTRARLAQLLNASGYVQRLKATGFRGQIITQTAVGRWITEQGCPTNADGKTLNLADVCAWLVLRYKDGGRDKPAGGAGEIDDDELATRLRKHVGSGDVVGLLGELMNYCDLEKAKAVSGIVVNVINAEKGRVKAQADEYERRLRNGELLESSAVQRERIARARFIRETLEGIGEFAPRLQGKSIVEIRAEMEEIGRELCETLACADSAVR